MDWPPLPDYGYFPRWPQDGDEFIHPDDRKIASSFIPGGRVLRREKFDGTYYHYRYGQTRLRLRPAMWRRIKHDGIDIGDQVETIGMVLERELFVATVWGMHYVARKGCILYRLRRGELAVPRLYSANNLRLLTHKERVGEPTYDHPPPKWEGQGDLPL